MRKRPDFITPELAEREGFLLSQTRGLNGLPIWQKDGGALWSATREECEANGYYLPPEHEERSF
jgi:hypothetical protein